MDKLVYKKEYHMIKLLSLSDININGEPSRIILDTINAYIADATCGEINLEDEQVYETILYGYENETYSIKRIDTEDNNSGKLAIYEVEESCFIIED